MATEFVANTNVERLPPQNIEAEQAVLGSMLIDPEAIERVAQFLQPEDFYREAHQHIFRAGLALYERREPTDFVTICDELERMSLIEEVGNESYVASLTNVTPTSVHAEHYGHIVERHAVMRRIISAAAEIASIGYDTQLEIDDALDRAEQVLFGLARHAADKDFVHIRPIVDEYWEKLTGAREGEQAAPGIQSGFKGLDRLTAGLQRSDLIIIAGRPSTGKTTLALNIASSLAILDPHVPVGIFSLEMSAEQLAQRFLCMLARVDSHRLRLGELTEREWENLTSMVGALTDAPIYVDDSGFLNSMDLRTKARRLQARANIGLLIVDYLQLIQGRRGGDNRVQEISEISRSLKALARELNIPVIALSQLSRAVEQRENHRPMLSDLRESGALEQDSDLVMFVYREELYDEDSRQGEADIIVAKHRNGPTGTVTLKFLNQYFAFEDMQEQRQTNGAPF
ncbi:MAG: replicative DNA helicase [Chloroflexota bacterium]|nr:replicative DNA helicase [Chloroflexota bacterium]MDE2839599.1 replicative DNA helicase [Chloroflexota bacterium]MDE2930140.1 replicative DNA helicase [Chloroflexota bacterium]